MKKIVSILIALILVLNVFGCLFTVHVAAVAPAIAALLEVVKWTAIGFLGGETASAIVNGSNTTNDFNAEYFKNQSIQALENGTLIDATLDEHNITTFSVSDDCPAESLEYATMLVGELNSLPEVVRFSDPQGINTSVSARQYEAVKTKVVNAYEALITAKQHDLELTDFNNGLSALASALGHEWTPSYNFDFVGPMSPIEFEAQTSFLSDMVDYEGFRLYPAHATVLEHSNYSTYSYAFASEGAALAYVSGIPGATSMNVTLIDDNWRYYDGYIPVIEFESNTYELLGNYVIYNGEIYFNKKSTINNGYGSVNVTPNANSINNFYSASGVSLASAGCTDINGLYTGVYAKPTGSVASGDIPEHITVSDITDDADPLSFDYLYTEDELPVSAAIAAGILSSNPDLIIDENGNIVSADGITLAQLQQIADQIMEGQLQFEDFEEYLSYIAGLLMAANVKSDTITDVLNGLRAYEKEQADALDDINEKLASIAGAMEAAPSITADKTFDVDTPSSIIDKFPFSLPFDIYRVFNLLSAEPVAPHWTFDFEMEGVYDFPIEIDLSDYEWIANIVRWLVYAAFVVGLILITNKLIGRG